MSNLDIPFDHPWSQEAIGSIGNVTVGGTPRTSIKEYWDGDVPWMASGDVHLKRITDVPTRITKLGLRFSNATLVEPPAVAISLAGQGKTRGTVALVLCQLCTNQSVALIKGSATRVVTDYLFYNLEFRYEELRSRSAGEGRAGLSKQILEQVPLPLPPLPDQTRIAEILSSVDRTIAQTESLIAKQQRIQTGLMQDLLTRGIDELGNLRSEQTHQFKDSPLGCIPVEWEVERIEQKLDRIVDYRGRTPTKVEAGVPLLTAKNVRDGYLDEEPREFIAESAFNSWMTRGIPKPDDVLFTTEAPMGNVAWVPKYRIALAQRVLTLCPKPNELSQDFLFWLLHWRRSTERLELLTSGSTVVGLKQSVFRKVEFRFPGLKEQTRISAILNSLDSTSDNQRSKLTKLCSLKTALMQDLLTGKRRVHGETTSW